MAPHPVHQFTLRTATLAGAAAGLAGTPLPCECQLQSWKLWRGAVLLALDAPAVCMLQKRAHVHVGPTIVMPCMA